MPGRLMSNVYRARPETFAGPSTRGTRLPSSDEFVGHAYFFVVSVAGAVGSTPNTRDSGSDCSCGFATGVSWVRDALWLHDEVVDDIDHVGRRSREFEDLGLLGVGADGAAQGDDTAFVGDLDVAGLEQLVDFNQELG